MSGVTAIFFICTSDCTVAEAEANCLRGTGCGHDHDLIWTSDEGIYLRLLGPYVTTTSTVPIGLLVTTAQNYDLEFTMELASDWVPATGQFRIIIGAGVSANSKNRYPTLYFRPSSNRMLIQQVTGLIGHSLNSDAGVKFVAGSTYTTYSWPLTATK